MAFRRRLGNLADTLLQQHLGRRAAEHQSGLVKQRQLELAEQRQAEIARQAEVNRQHEMLQKILSDPTGGVASALQRANIKVDGYDLNALMPTSEQITGQIGSSFPSKAEELPTDVGIQDLLRKSARPEMAQDPRYVAPLMTARDEKRGAILGGLHDTKRAEAVPGPIKSMSPAGVEQVQYATPFEAADMGAMPTERTAAQQGGREATVVQMQNRAYAERAAAESWARLPAQLKLEQEKRIAELAQIGNRVGAEQAAQRNAAITGLLPTYHEYRKLATKVSASWAGAGSSSSANVVNAVSKMPVIGEMVASGLEAGHSALVDVVDPETAKDIAELNRLTDTLAQGMANAVLGNKGQTTENDRRTAKNILASSFTDAKTLEDLLAITDKMFTKMPTVAGQILEQDPFATAAQILEATKAEVDKERAGQAGPADTAPFVNQPFPANPAAQTSPSIGPSIGPAGGSVPVPTLEEILRRPPRR